MNKFKIVIIAITVLLGLTFSDSSYAAKDNTIQLTADTIDYDANQKLVQAKGSVKISQEQTILSGSYAEYRSDSGIAMVTGGIVVTSATVHATGNQVEYNTNSGKAVLSGNPRLEDKDGAWMTGDVIEYYAKEERAVITGNVHIVHPVRQVDATAEHGTYYGNERKFVLTGNARAVQEGNTLIGETLTVYMDNKAMDAKGGTKLIIIPNGKN